MDSKKTLADPQDELENPTELYAVKVCVILLTLSEQPVTTTS